MHPENPSQGLRLRALGGDEPGGDEPVGLGAAWASLKAGSSRIEDAFASKERLYLILADRAEDLPVARRPPAHHLDILERLLLCGAQKEVAYACTLSSSSIATAAKRSLAFMGFGGVPSKAPALLILAAHTRLRGGTYPGERCKRVSDGDTTCRVFIAPRPDLVLEPALTSAEFAVVQALVEGKSHAEIAAERGASRRTVANQLATAFHRLGVHGRSDLLARLAQEALSRGADARAP